VPTEPKPKPGVTARPVPHPTRKAAQMVRWAVRTKARKAEQTVLMRSLRLSVSASKPVL